MTNIQTYITKIRQTNSKNAYFVMICTCVYYVQLLLAKQESPISATLLKVCKTLYNVTLVWIERSHVNEKT